MWVRKNMAHFAIGCSVARKLEPNRLGSNAAFGGTYVVRFRLTNEGNQPIFYPVSRNTNRPIDHLVYRINGLTPDLIGACFRRLNYPCLRQLN